MVLIWTGRGLVVLFVFVLMAAIAIVITATQIAEPAHLSDDQAIRLMAAIASFLSAIATYPLGRFVMKQPQDKALAGGARGQAQAVRSRDSLFWIEMRYWTYIFAAIAGIMLALTFAV